MALLVLKFNAAMSLDTCRWRRQFFLLSLLSAFSMETPNPLYLMSDIGCTLFWGFLPGMLAFTFPMCSYYGSLCQAQVQFTKEV